MVRFEQKFLVTVNLRPFVRGFAGVVWACLSWSAGPQARAAGNDLLRLPEGWRLASELMAGFPAHGLQLFVCNQQVGPRRNFIQKNPDAYLRRSMAAILAEANLTAW